MGIRTLITTLTASSSASLADTSSMTSAYDEYMFVFIDIHPSAGAHFTFQVNADGQSGYNETMTTTFVRSVHKEDANSSGLSYTTSYDQAQGTAYHQLCEYVGNDADESLSGILHVFNPASTTYVTHFYSRTQHQNFYPASDDTLTAGYINTTAAITDISFKMASGNIDAGVIQIYGIS